MVEEKHRFGETLQLLERATLGYIGEPDNSAFCVIERRDLQTQAA